MIFLTIQIYCVRNLFTKMPFLWKSQYNFQFQRIPVAIMQTTLSDGIQHLFTWKLIRSIHTFYKYRAFAPFATTFRCGFASVHIQGPGADHCYGEGVPIGLNPPQVGYVHTVTTMPIARSNVFSIQLCPNSPLLFSTSVVILTTHH